MPSGAETVQELRFICVNQRTTHTFENININLFPVIHLGRQKDLLAGRIASATN